MRKKFEILVPTWPRSNREQFWGDTKYGPYSGTDSVKIHFRGMSEGDTITWSTDEARAMMDVILYIWFDKQGTFSIDLRLADIHTMTLREAELRVKLLKKLINKLSKASFPVDQFIRGNEILELLRHVFSALGVKRSVQYHGIAVDETYVPIDDVTKVIASEINERLSRISN